MKKGSGIFYKIVFYFNLLFALVTGIALLIPYTPVTFIPALSAISLIVPLLVFVNVVFVLFWRIRKKRKYWLSLILLILWYIVLGPFYLFSKQKEVKDNKDSFSIMSFNARGFNKNGQIKIPHVDSLIIDFVEMQNPDILCFQECHYNMKNNNALSQYKYKFVNYSKANYPQKVIQAIYSKFPIIKVDSIYFPETSNGTIYADILMGKDTLRVYNVHLQSFKIIPRMKTFKKERSTKLMARIRNTMLKQYEQAKIIRENMEKCEYKKIIVGDFNSTQYSNIYRLIKGDFDDSFLERGKGFGRSYDLRGLPMRIDYILTDPAFEVISHQNFDEKLSDHYPVMATLRLKSEE